MRRSLAPAALLLCALGACGDDAATPPPPEPALVWDPGAGILGAFPDDAFARDDAATRTGTRLDFDPATMPELDKIPQTFKDIFADLNTLDGFGLSAGIQLRFTVPIDTALLRSGEATASWQAPILLVTVDDAGAPTLHAYEVQSIVDDDTTVILEPMAPLPAATRGFLAITPALRARDGKALTQGASMRAALAGTPTGSVRAERVAPRMREAAALAVAQGAAADVASLPAVVVFTTQSAREDAVAIAADIAARTVAADPGIVCTPEPLWLRCEGTFQAVDYRGADGFIEDLLPGGAGPDDSQTYTLPFTVWLPLTLPGPYGDPPPVMIFGHGLGGERQQAERLAEFAAPRGLATIAIDAVEHGAHPTADADSTLLRVLGFFGIDVDTLGFEPLEMREHFRQSTFDGLQLVRLLELGLDLDGDLAPDLDPARVMYLGVSLGGIMGPPLLALAPSIQLAVLVVPGGRVSSIVRDAPQFAALIELLRPADATDGDVARFFPVLQTLIDRGDAAIWAVGLLDPAARPAGLPAAAPHLLFGMVIDDDTVPNSANRALARALGVPQVPPVLQAIGLVPVTGAAPIKANLPDGRTAGLLQFDRVEQGGGSLGTEPATHGNIGDSAVGVEAWLTFIESWLTSGEPEIIDPYAVLGL